MEIRRYLLSEIPIDEIEPLIRASFFASPGFLNLWKVRDGTAVWWMVRIDNATAAVLPAVEFGKGPFTRLYSTPNGCYGRLCFAQGLDNRTKEETARNLITALADAGYMKVFLSDFYRCFDGVKSLESNPCETRLIDISAPDWQPPHRKVRQDIARAEREGVVIEPFNGEKHLAGFFELVGISHKRIGVDQKYKPEFFRALEQLSRQDDRVRWVWCEHEGRPMVSSIFLMEGDNLLYWHVYFDEALSHLQATKYIIFKVARESVARGVRYLNMGGSPDHVAGVHGFKEKWGGELYQYRCLYRKSLLGRMI